MILWVILSFPDSQQCDDTAIKADISALQTGKVDKVDSMGLISDSEKQRLSAVTNYDDTEIKTSLSALQTILENAGKLGVLLPKKLKEILIQLKEENND